MLRVQIINISFSLSTKIRNMDAPRRVPMASSVSSTDTRTAHAPSHASGVSQYVSRNQSSWSQAASSESGSSYTLLKKETSVLG